MASASVSKASGHAVAFMQMVEALAPTLEEFAEMHPPIQGEPLEDINVASAPLAGNDRALLGQRDVQAEVHGASAARCQADVQNEGEADVAT